MSKVFKVLYVEDDLASAKIVSRFLEKKGMSIRHIANGLNITFHVIRESPDCILLDICLPGLSGYDLIRKIREVYSGHIVFITSHATEKIEIISLKLGVDDFISKTVSLDLLYARLMRFKGKNTELHQAQMLQVRELLIDKKELICTWQRKDVKLTKDELNALYYFALNKDRIITREELFIALVGVPFDGISRGMDIKISRIREKLDNVGLNKDVLQSCRGHGYKFDSMKVYSTLPLLSEGEIEFIAKTVSL